jgi:hypothetical protein
VKNPNPIGRAYRLEKRRKELGCQNPRCFYCGESDIFCLENDHPVSEELDAEFTRIVCRNCHRKREAERDLLKLTKNGLRKPTESKHSKSVRHRMLLANDLDSISDLLTSSPASASLPMIADAVHAVATSLRREASSS